MYRVPPVAGLLGCARVMKGRAPAVIEVVMPEGGRAEKRGSITKPIPGSRFAGRGEAIMQPSQRNHHANTLAYVCRTRGERRAESHQ